MYVCIYIYICIYHIINAYIYIYICLYVYKSQCVCIYIYTHIERDMTNGKRLYACMLAACRCKFCPVLASDKRRSLPIGQVGDCTHASCQSASSDEWHECL